MKKLRLLLILSIVTLTLCLPAATVKAADTVDVDNEADFREHLLSDEDVHIRLTADFRLFQLLRIDVDGVTKKVDLNGHKLTLSKDATILIGNNKNTAKPTVYFSSSQERGTIEKEPNGCWREAINVKTAGGYVELSGIIVNNFGPSTGVKAQAVKITSTGGKVVIKDGCQLKGEKSGIGFLPEGPDARLEIDGATIYNDDRSAVVECFGEDPSSQIEINNAQLQNNNFVTEPAKSLLLRLYSPGGGSTQISRAIKGNCCFLGTAIGVSAEVYDVPQDAEEVVGYMFHIYNLDLDEETYTYDGTEKRPEVSGTLDSDKYDVAYEDNVNAGKAKAIITFNDEEGYSGTLEKNFTIKPIDISDMTATLSYTKCTYNGKYRRPKVTIDGLEEGKDFDVSGSRKSVGTGTVTITGKGNYYSTLKKSFTVSPKTIYGMTAKLSYTKYTYNGNTRKPKVYIAGLKAGKDFTVSGGRKSIGTGTLKITGRGNYKGNTYKKFRVVPAKVTIYTPKVGKNKVTVRYKKVRGWCYYRIAYKQKGSSKWRYTTSKNSYKTIKKLRSGKYYYVKVRACKKVSDKMYYGAYSSTKRVTIK